MRTLIFGCGYLGLRVARAWIHQGHEVHAITRSTDRAAVLQESGIHPIVADVCDPATLTKLPAADVVLHAIGFDRNSGKTQEEVTRGGTQTLLNAIRDRYERLIHISSTSVYGQCEGEWVNELSDCTPTQPGGQLALAAEGLIREAHAASPNSKPFILRLAGIYGPGRLLSRIETLKSGQTLSGRGDAWLNLIHVDDAANAVLKCGTCNLPGGTFVIADDQPLLRREYFEMLARLVNAPAPNFDPSLPSQRGSGGINKRCSNRRARQELDWRPNYSSATTGLPASIEPKLSS
jgi:nucleoside-diphosphate-sugar epimerase